MTCRKAGSTLVSLCLACLVGCEAHDQVLPWRPSSALNPASISDAATLGSTDAASLSGMSGAVPVLSATDSSTPDAMAGDSALSVVDAEPGALDAASTFVPMEDAAVATPHGPAPAPQPRAKDPDCDLNGFWAVRQVTRSEALLTSQFANNFFLFQFSHDGESVTATAHVNCALVILGSATGRVTRATGDAIRSHNSQVGRKGKMFKTESGTCHFEMERFWYARGVTEARFVPKPRNALVSLAQVRADNPLPTPARPDGAEDWENDGKLGMAVQLTGIISGVRNSVTRDFTDWYTDSALPIRPQRDWQEDIRAVAHYEGEETIFDPTTGLLAQLAQQDAAAKNTLRLHFLGRDKSDPRAAAVLRADAFETCQALQALLPEKASLEY